MQGWQLCWISLTADVWHVHVLKGTVRLCRELFESLGICVIINWIRLPVLYFLLKQRFESDHFRQNPDMYESICFNTDV